MTTPSSQPPAPESKPPESGEAPASGEVASATASENPSSEPKDSEPEAPEAAPSSRVEDGLAALKEISIESGPPPDPFLDGEADALLRRYLSLPPIRVSAAPDDEATPGDASAKIASDKPDLDQFRRYDAKLLELEPYLAGGNWDRVLEILEAEKTLPPQLALVLALGQRERDVADAQPERMAITAMAALLGVPEDNEAAVLLAKRILRRNPVAWQRRRAPRAHVSFVIVLVIAILGAAVGYLAGPAVPIFE